MLNFLHNFNPEPILVSLGPIHIYWYGLFIVLGILLATLVAFKLASFYNISKNTIFDSAFYTIFGGLIGARIYYIFLELPFYIEHPLDIFKVWNGGLAIHGGLIGGLIVLLYFCRKYKLNFWLLSAIYAPGLALAQTIGRWGNYFNQELFGTPTNLPWGIPILPENRMMDFFNFDYFHPTFFYESIGNFFIFIILITIHSWIIKKKITGNKVYVFILGTYLLLYSILRFFMEFLRIDNPSIVSGLNVPQIVSLIIIGSILAVFVKNIFTKRALEK